METIKIIIEKSADYYDAYAENCDGIYGAGESIEAAKKDVLKGLELFISSRPKKDLPAILQGEYEIVYQYDTQSFLNYYNKIFTNVALERITGINQKLLHHYSSGLKKPRFKQRKKIETALHRLGRELITLEL
ncbi:transcriptional regulator [Bacteroidia bacterium]|nr:transcriptional regulator [Bacteroidia bacterium]